MVISVCSAFCPGWTRLVVVAGAVAACSAGGGGELYHSDDSSPPNATKDCCNRELLLLVVVVKILKAATRAVAFNINTKVKATKQSDDDMNMPLIRWLLLFVFLRDSILALVLYVIIESSWLLFNSNAVVAPAWANYSDRLTKW